MNATQILLMTALGAPLLSAQGNAPAGPPKLQALIITGQNGHDWRGTTPILKQVLEDTGRFEVRVTEEFRGAGPETLAPYDLVVVNYFERNQPGLLWGDRANGALAEYVRAGKGLVLYHFSIAAFNGWTDYVAAVRVLANGPASDSQLGDSRFVSSARIPAPLQELAWSSTTPFLSVLVSPGFRPVHLVVDPAAGYFWLPCALASANSAGAVPAPTRSMIQSYACQHRR